MKSLQFILWIFINYIYIVFLHIDPRVKAPLQILGTYLLPLPGEGHFQLVTQFHLQGFLFVNRLMTRVPSSQESLEVLNIGFHISL